MSIKWKTTKAGTVRHAEVAPGIAFCGTRGLMEPLAHQERCPQCARCRIAMEVEGRG